MAATQWEPIYWGGQEGFSAFAADVPQPLIDGAIVALDEATAFALAGYSNVPGYNVNANTQPQRSAGAYQPIGFNNHRREFTVDNQIEISTGANCLKFMQAAMRTTPTSVYAAENRYQCLPVLTYMGGFIGACDDARTFPWIARDCLMNTATFTFAQGQVPTMQFQLWPLFIDFDPGTDLLPTVTVPVLAAAGAVPYVFQNLSFNVGSGPDDKMPGITNLVITVNNNLRRKGTRHNANGAIANAARAINVGPEDVSVQLSLDAPFGLLDNTPLGNITAALTDGTTVRTLSLGASADSGVNFYSNNTQNSTAPDADATFSATISSSQIKIA